MKKKGGSCWILVGIFPDSGIYGMYGWKNYFYFSGFGSVWDNMDNPGQLQFYLLGPLGTQPGFIWQNNFVFRIEEITYEYVGFPCFPYMVGYLQCYLQKYVISGSLTPQGAPQGAYIYIYIFVYMYIHIFILIFIYIYIFYRYDPQLVAPTANPVLLTSGANAQDNA